MKKQALRVSIKPHLQPYVKSVADQLGTDDLTEAITYILTNLKLGNQPIQQEIQHFDKPVQVTPIYQEHFAEDDTVQRLARLIEEF